MTETPRDTASRRVTRPGPVPRQNGSAIADFRDLKHMSQAALARAVGVTQPAIWQIENETVNARLITLKAIAGELSVRIGSITRHREQDTEAHPDAGAVTEGAVAA